ncbi:hypothetical protein EIP86_002737 [Pleurotus ostreatoroseus]|nr:hypothetical protein EIP86_002737 [Pleurotus ostreatoroseus]
MTRLLMQFTGGYCKEYVKGSRPVGVMLDDTWFLKISTPDPADVASSKHGDFPKMTWERRKRPSTAYAPSLRSGCTMTPWTARNTGIMFGGVTDEDTGEETMESVFHNDLYVARCIIWNPSEFRRSNGYQITGNGRWISMPLKKPKKKGGPRKKPQVVVQREDVSDQEDVDEDAAENNIPAPAPVVEPDVDLDDPLLTTPLPRYNAMLAVVRNTLYIYGGIYEKGSREYTLDDFHSIQLDKLDRYVCLKESNVVIDAGEESSSDEEDGDESDESEDGSDDEGDDKDDDKEPEEQPATVEDQTEGKEEAVDDEQKAREKEALRAKATAFMGVSKDSTRSAEDALSTPLPGETVAMFYARSREYWAGKAHQTSDNRGKMLRRDGFALAQERYDEYKPILEEVEKILAEAGLDEEEMRRGAAAGPRAAEGQSRNRR